jgi:uncharacterized RDD family membrane protein YckC
MNGTFFCNKCGEQNAAGAQFCSRCGAATTPAPGAVQTPAGFSSAAAAYPAVAAMPVVRYGGFWIRVVAAIIDVVILRVVLLPIRLIFGGLGLAGMMSGAPHIGFGLGLLGGGVMVVAMFLGGWLYEAFMESSSYQATLGKMICGMKVTDLNGNRICFGRATGRHFAKILSGLTLCIGYIMVGLTERKQGLHDLIAETLVRRP